MAAFISYAREDADVADLISQEIAELHGEIAIDHEIRGGQEWWDQICDWIESCELFVLVLSDSSVNSEACRAEIGFAIAMHRPILPLAVDDVDVDRLPLDLKRFNIVRYLPDAKESYKKIVLTLRGLGPTPPRPDPEPDRPPLPESYADPFRRALAAPSVSLEDQVSIFAVLKLHTADPRRREEALALIGELRARPDVAVATASDIDAFLASLPPGPSDAAPLPPPPVAQLIVTRPKQALVGRAGAIHLELDGKRVLAVDNDQTVTVEVPAGPHAIQAVTWMEAIGSRSDTLDMVLASGSAVTLRVRFKSSLKGGLELLQVV